MTPLSILLYVALALAGFIFQSLLRGGVRAVIYPLSFALGTMAGYYFGQYALYALSFNAGMISRAAVGGYWHCVLLEAVCLALGALGGFYFI